MLKKFDVMFASFEFYRFIRGGNWVATTEEELDCDLVSMGSINPFITVTRWKRLN
ncbi:MAG: hypothetical protein RLY43_1412 [Bacteroidota bacterium]